MALSKVTSFNWEKIIRLASDGEGLRPLLQLRGKANEIVSNHSHYSAKPAPIDFQSYRSKLKFVAASVDGLEKLYANKKLPQYTATLPDFEAKKRVALIQAAKVVSDAAEADLVNLRKQLDEFDLNRFNEDSTSATAYDRFPNLGKEVEEEINQHKWFDDQKFH